MTMQGRWRRGLSFLVSASMVLGLVPAPALAEAIGEAQPEEVVSQDGATPKDDAAEKSKPEGAPVVEDLSNETVSEERDAESQKDVLTVQSVDEGDEVQGIDGQDDGAEPPILMTQSVGIEAVDIEAGNNYSIEVEEGGYWVGRFTVTEDAQYEFYTESEDDTYGSLYEDEALDNEIDSNDDAGSGSNFRIVHNLAEGQTVYLKVRQYNDLALSATVGVRALTSSHDLSEGSIRLSGSDFAAGDEVASEVASAVSVYDNLGNLVDSGDYELVFYTYAWDDDAGEDVYTKVDAPTNRGEYYVAAHGTGSEDEGYYGETGKVDFVIYDSNDLGSDYWTRTLNGSFSCELAYTGSELALPSVQVYHGEVGDDDYVSLTQDEDFELSGIWYCNDDGTTEKVPSVLKIGSYVLNYIAKDGTSYTGAFGVELGVVDASDLSYGRIELSTNEFAAGEGLEDAIAGAVTVYDRTGGVVGSDNYYLVYYYWNEDTGVYAPMNAAPTSSGTYYVAAHGTGSEDEGFYGSTDVAWFELKGALATTELILGETVAATPDDDGNWYGTFTATEAGAYEFYSEGDSDSWAELYGDAALVDYLDQNGGGADRNFSLSKVLQAGESVWLKVVCGGQESVVGVRKLDVSDLSMGSISLDSSNYLYTQEAVVLGARVYDRVGAELEEGTDYELAYYTEEWDEEAEEYVYTEVDAPSGPGFYYVAARGTGSYSGETDKCWFRIDDRANLGGGYWELRADATGIAYTGEPVVLKGIGVYHGYENWDDYAMLEEGTDYELVYFDNDGNELLGAPTECGSYYVKACGKGSCSGETGPLWFDIAEANDLGGEYWRKDFVNGVSQFEYTGQAVGLAAHVWRDDDGSEVTLREGEDYQLKKIVCQKTGKEVDGAIDVGIYTATYEGIGSYHGSFKLGFLIYDDDCDDYDLSQGYVRLWQMGYSAGDMWILPEDLDVYNWRNNWVDRDYYDVVYYDEDGVELPETPSVPGTYQVAARANGEGDYKGESPKAQFEVYGENNIAVWNGRFRDGNQIAFTSDAVVLSEPLIYRWDEAAEEDEYLTLGEDFEFDHFESDSEEEIEAPSALGSYYAVYRGIGSYTGTSRIRFEIVDANDISTILWDWYYRSTGEFPYTGKPIELPAPRIVPRADDGDDTKSLELGTDIEYVDYYDEADGERHEGTPTEVGSYRAYYRGIGDYSGECEVWFYIVDASDLSQGRIELATDVFAAGDGIEEAVAGAVTVYDFTDNEVDSDNYDLVYYRWDDDDGEYVPMDAAPTNPGTYYVAARGKGSDGEGYHGETEKREFSLKGPIEATTLVFGETVTAAPDDDGDWYGTFTATEAGVYEFYSVGDSDPWAYLYGDAALVNYLSENDDYGDDYNFSLARALQPGESVWLKVECRGQETTVGVREADVSDLSAGRVSLDAYRLVYTQEAVSLGAHVYDRVGTELKKGTDYELVYYAAEWDDDLGCYPELAGAPTECGRYYVTACGKGSYSGETNMQWFSIVNKVDLGGGWWDLVVDDTYDYTGAPIEPTGVKVIHCEDAEYYETVPANAYELVYYDYDGEELSGAPTEGGRYSVAARAIEGKGYTGETETRQIHIYDEQSVAECSFYCDSWYEYTGSPVVLTGYSVFREYWDDSGEYQRDALTEDADYELVFFDNNYKKLNGAPTKMGNYYVAAKGKGNYYRGTTIKQWFQIRASISDAVPQLNDAVAWESERNDEGTWIFTVFDALADLGDLVWNLLFGGNALMKGADYTVGRSVYQIVYHSDEDWVDYDFRGIDNYYGTVHATVYRGAIISIADAEVSAEDATYTGQEIKPNVTVTLGDKKLVRDKDYTVECQNNKDAGTASIIVTGVGAYEDTAYGRFAIAKASSSISIADQSVTYTGNSIAYSGKVTRGGSAGAVSYAYYSDAACTKAVKAADVVAVGTYYVKATLAADANHNGASATAKLTVAKAASSISIADQSVTYTGNSIAYSGKVT
ncbi:MAG: hypothetical protein IKG18_13685, partial [Atopobiaceae bacterium]|nr:hypothetical protein [Atopobiaceae bacterium]